MREAGKQADVLALLHGFLKHNHLLADIHSPACPVATARRAVPP